MRFTEPVRGRSYAPRALRHAGTFAIERRIGRRRGRAWQMTLGVQRYPGRAQAARTGRDVHRLITVRQQRRRSRGTASEIAGTRTSTRPQERGGTGCGAIGSMKCPSPRCTCSEPSGTRRTSARTGSRKASLSAPPCHARTGQRTSPTSNARDSSTSSSSTSGTAGWVSSMLTSPKLDDGVRVVRLDDTQHDASGAEGRLARRFTSPLGRAGADDIGDRGSGGAVRSQHDLGRLEES